MGAFRAGSGGKRAKLRGSTADDGGIGSIGADGKSEKGDEEFLPDDDTGDGDDGGENANLSREVRDLMNK
jgi:hypothetical protein